MPTPRPTAIAAAVAALSLSSSLLLPLPAAAQAGAAPPAASDAPDTTVAPQRVEITGTNIKRIDTETADPVQIIRREDIQNSGATTVRELLDTLPSTNNGLSDLTGSNSFASGGTSASMRNLGKQSTLVLLNGRRLSPYALADFNEVFTNIDTLPLGAVDRVEILKNGASAVYGSDAVAGVINIITRKDYRGFEAGGSYEQSLVSHRFGEGSVHATWGLGDPERDHYNLLVNVEHMHRDNVMWRDVLPYTSDATRAAIPQGTAQYSTYSYPGNLMGDRSQGVAPKAVDGCDPAMVINGLCMYDRYTRFEAQPAADRTNLLVSGHLFLGDAMEAFGELLYARTQTRYVGTLPYYGWAQSPVQWSDPNSDNINTFYYRGLPAEHPLNNIGQEEEFRYRFLDLQDAGLVATSDNYRFLTGLRGTTRGYDWETALSFLGGGAKTDERGSFSNSGFIQEIGDYNKDMLDPDFFNKPGGYHIGQPNSAQVLDTLFPHYGTRGRTRQVALDGKVSGELGVALPGGPIGFALGGDLRHESFRIDATSNLMAGDIVGYGLSRVDAQRSFGAVFTEFSLPVTKSLELDAAARVDKFPGFAAHVSPKLGLRFQPMKELLLRGTVEGGFRAPNLTESANSSKLSFTPGVNDPSRCPQAEAYATDLRNLAASLPQSDPQRATLTAQADQIEGQECNAGIAQRTSYNPNLKPEVSRGYSLGMVFAPLRDLSVQLDYWNIARRDEIGLKSLQELLANEANLPEGVSVTRGALGADDPSFSADNPFGLSAAQLQQKYGVTAGPLHSITNSFENVSKTKTDGIDLEVVHELNTPIGHLKNDLVATWLRGLYYYSTVINAYGDNLAGRYYYPRLGLKLKTSLQTGPVLNGLTANYYSSTSLHDDYYDTEWNDAGCERHGLTPDQCRYGAYVRWDYSLSYTGIRNLTLSAYVRNVFNRMPPFDARLMSNGAVIPQQVEEVQRRTLRLGLDYKFW
jgi:iron complex outermembrane receptor protein